MITRHLLPTASLLCTLLLSTGCKSRDEGGGGLLSPTVNPSDPASLAPGSQSQTSASSAPAASSSTPSGVQTTASGLQYQVLRPGTGKSPTSYNRVKVHYHGTLQDGTVFDSSVQRGEPSTFGLGQVISGWREGIPLMREGAKYRFTVPPHLAYGSRGMPPKIGPNETLIFDVELLKVVY